MEPDFDATGERRRVDYGAAFRRRWWVLALLAIVGLVLGGLAYEVQPSQYQATAQVQVTPTGAEDTSQQTSGTRTQGVVNLDNETQLVTSTPVADRAANALKKPGQGTTLVQNVTVTVPANTAILSITYQDSTAAAAQQGAQAFAQAYLDNRSAVAAGTIAAKVKGLTGQRDALDGQLRDVAGQVAALSPTSPSRTVAVSEQSVLSQQVAGLNNQIAQLQGTPITPGSIVLAPKLPPSPSSPILLLDLASGLVAGLVIGSLIVFLLARPRAGRKISHVDDMQGLFDGPVVLASRVTRGVRSGTDKRLARRQYQQLANAVLFLGNRQPTIVLVTGATSGPAGAVAAAGVAEAISRRGLRTALVDADLDSGTLTALTASKDAPGLSDVLVGERPLEDVATRGSTSGYELVPVGGRANEAAHVAQVPKLRRIFQSMRSNVDVIVISAPSTSESLEAELMAGLADGVIVAVEAKRSRQSDVEDAVEQMRAVGTPVLGAVLMGPAKGAASQVGPHRKDDRNRSGQALGPLSREEVDAFEQAATRGATAPRT